MMILGQYRAALAGIWWYWVSMGQILGQNNLVLFGFKWSWVNEGLLCLYILKKGGDLVRCYHSGTNEQTNKQGMIEILSHALDHGRLR